MHLLFSLLVGRSVMGEVYDGFVNKVILHSFLLIVMALGFSPQCATSDGSACAFVSQSGSCLFFF